MDAIVALIALTAMEIVLGIDNIVFIAILSSRLPPEQQAKARQIGLGAALGTRLLLLLSLSWILSLTTAIFTLTDLGMPRSFIEMLATDRHQGEHGAPASEEEKDTPPVINEYTFKQINEVSWRDLILLAGGLFLIWKSVGEIHEKIEGHHGEKQVKEHLSFGSVIAQIAFLDIIFSLDSVITAVGMAKDLWVMITAVIIAVGVMLVFAGRVSAFVEKHPTVKMLALSFLILIGVMLVVDGCGGHIPKGYIYFAMGFALMVEALNLRMKLKHLPPQGSQPVPLA